MVATQDKLTDTAPPSPFDPPVYVWQSVKVSVSSSSVPPCALMAPPGPPPAVADVAHDEKSLLVISSVPSIRKMAPLCASLVFSAEVQDVEHSVKMESVIVVVELSPSRYMAPPSASDVSQSVVHEVNVQKESDASHA